MLYKRMRSWFKIFNFGLEIINNIRMKPNLSILLLVICLGSTYKYLAQEYTYNWYGVVNSMGHNHVRTVFDRDNNIIAYGSFSGLTDLDPSEGVYEAESDENELRYFVSKISNTGELVWVKMFFTMGGISDYTIQEVAVDEQNEIYVAGGFRYGVNFDSTTEEWSFFSEGQGFSGYLAKLDEHGNTMFVKPFYNEPIHTSISQDFRVNSLEVSSEKLVIGGHFNGKVDFDPGPDSLLQSSYEGPYFKINSFVVLMNELGELEELVSLNGSGNNYIISTSLSDDQELICLGMFSDSLFLSDNSFGDTLVTMAQFGTKNFIFKRSNTGEIEWILEPLWKVIDAKLIRKSNDELYLSGKFDGGICLENDVFDYDSYFVGGEYYYGGPFSGTGGVILSLDETCRIKWGRIFRSNDYSEITDLDILKNGNLIATGRFFDSVFVQRDFVRRVGENEPVLLTLSSEGDLLTLNGFGLPYMRISSVDYQKGYIVCGGQMQGYQDLEGYTSADLNFDGVQTPLLEFEGHRAGVVIHYGASFFSNGSDLNVFPNPSYGNLTVELSEPIDNEQLVLIDSYGRIVKQYNTTIVKNSYTIESIKSGAYYLAFRGKSYKIIVI